MNSLQIVRALKNHFDPLRSSVANLDQNVLKRVLGVTLSGAELVQLAGAPVGSRVTMQEVVASIDPPGPYDPPTKGEHVPAGLLLTVQNAAYIDGENKVILFNEGDGSDSIGIYIKLVMFHPRSAATQIPQGIGAMMIRSMLDGTCNLPNFPRTFSRMTMMAAGGRSWGKMDASGRRWSGFAVWPKYGFDRPLLKRTTSMAQHFSYYPENLLACTRVSHLLALTADGEKYWSLVGDGWYMDFDLTPNGTAEARLNAYLGGLK